jgi:hypothetical protein
MRQALLVSLGSLILSNASGPANPGGAALTPMLTTETKITASDAAAGDRFGGGSVAVNGDTAIVTATNWDCDVSSLNCGAAYVFVRTGSQWTEQQKLTASDAAAGDAFGAAAVSGDTAVVGANGDDCPASGDFCGAAYVFVRTGSVWTEQQKLTASDAAADKVFGVSVAVDGDTAVVGAWGAACAMAGANCGAAYVFVRTGSVWTEQQKLTASDAAAEDNLGISVALSGDTALVGAAGDNCPVSGDFCGAVYVFVRSGSVWTEQQKITASDAVMDARFGLRVALSGDTALVAAGGDQAAYAFVRSGSAWTEQQKLEASDAGAGFGRSIAVSGDTAVVGSDSHDCPAGQSCGAVYVFVRASTVWTEQQILTADDATSGDEFGEEVAVSGRTAVAGAGGDDCPVSGNNCGAAYVYEPPDPLFADNFDSGTLAAWSGAATDGGDLSVTTDAALSPGAAALNYGLQATVNDRNPLYVEDQTPAGELRYRVKFFFNPLTFDPGQAESHFRARILLGFETDPALRRQFAVVLRRQGGSFSLMVRTTRANGTRANTSFVALAPGPHSIQLDWQRSSAAGLADGSMTLWVDEVLQQTLTGIDTGLHGIDMVRLGPTSIKAGASGSLYFDRFESRRLAFIP